MAEALGPTWRIRLVAYGARLESVLSESSQGFESPILRHVMSRDICLLCRETCVIFRAIGLLV